MKSEPSSKVLQKGEPYILEVIMRAITMGRLLYWIHLKIKSSVIGFRKRGIKHSYCTHNILIPDLKYGFCG